MRRIIYLSHWADSIRQEPDLALQRIVALSIRNNRMNDISGFLVAHDGLFLQVLEGPHQKVEDTYGRIARDDRHDQLKVIDDSVANARQFRDWNMCGVLLETGGAHTVSQDEIAALVARPDAVTALDLLRRLSVEEAERERKAALTPR